MFVPANLWNGWVAVGAEWKVFKANANTSNCFACYIFITNFKLFCFPLFLVRALFFSDTGRNHRFVLVSSTQPVLSAILRLITNRLSSCFRLNVLSTVIENSEYLFKDLGTFLKKYEWKVFKSNANRTNNYFTCYIFIVNFKLFCFPPFLVRGLFFCWHRPEPQVCTRINHTASAVSSSALRYFDRCRNGVRLKSKGNGRFRLHLF